MSGYRVLYHHRIRADDGQAVHVRELIAALRRQGHEVRECALVPKADRAGAMVERPEPGSFWQRLALPRTAVEMLEVAYNCTGRRLLRGAAAGLRPDFLYERHALHCRAGLDVARELGVPLLLEVNAPMVDEMAELGLLRWPRRAAATERAVLHGADRVLPVTKVLADLLVLRGARPDAIRVIHNGADPARCGSAVQAAAAAVRQRLGLGLDVFAVGFVGYMRPWHRLDLVLQAMARSEAAALHLVLVGRGPALAPLLEQAAVTGLRQRVHVVGEVPPEVLPAHVAAFDAALIPAINRYASPLKLFDSLACSVPTVAPDQPNLREVLVNGETGVLFAPGDGDALAAALLRLCRDRGLARRLGEAGRARLVAERWTWDGNAERVIAAFEELR
jgi:glycosyltransferase involved in cell wall biosynthesis